MNSHTLLIATSEEAIEFGKSVGTWPAFPDSAESLARLNRMGLKQVILSNVNNDSFDLCVLRRFGMALAADKCTVPGRSSRRTSNLTPSTLPRRVSMAWSARQRLTMPVGSYKPQLRNFDYAIQHIKDEFGIGPEQILVVANSKLHDVLPCVQTFKMVTGAGLCADLGNRGHKKGLKAAWISRTTTKPVMGVSNFSSVQPDWTFFKMADFADEMAKFNP